MKVIRSSHNQFFEPTANKMESLAVLMLSIETEVVACVNKYIAIWRDTGRIVKPHPSKEDTVALPFSATLNQIIASHCSGMARSLIAKIEKADSGSQTETLSMGNITQDRFLHKRNQCQLEFGQSRCMDRRRNWFS